MIWRVYVTYNINLLQKWPINVIDPMDVGSKLTDKPDP